MNLNNRLNLDMHKVWGNGLVPYLVEAECEPAHVNKVGSDLQTSHKAFTSISGSSS